MNNNPKVSIVIPVYNGSNYLKQAIDSALNQTYDNIEIIVVNDGSTDNSEDIALSYGDKIKYIYKENGGSSSALNEGIKNMSGEYFSWLSHDDLYLSDKLEKQMEYASEDTVIFAGSDLIDSSGKIIKKANNLNKIAEYVNNHGNEYLIAQPSKYYFSGCTCLIPKKVFNKVGLFSEDLRLVNDYDMWFRIYKENYRIIFIPEVLVQSRMHASQVSRNTVFMHNTEEELLFWNNTLNWLNNNHADNKELFNLFAQCAYHQTIYEVGDKALNGKSNFKFKILKAKAELWMFMKKIYLKYWIDRK